MNDSPETHVFNLNDKLLKSLQDKDNWIINKVTNKVDEANIVEYVYCTDNYSFIICAENIIFIDTVDFTMEINYPYIGKINLARYKLIKYLKMKGNVK